MEGIREGFVIRDDVDVAAFHKVVEVFDSQVQGQQLAIKGGVLLLCGSQLPGEVCKRAPCVVNQLLEDCTHSGARGVSEDAGWGLWLRVDQKGSIGKSILD